MKFENWKLKIRTSPLERTLKASLILENCNRGVSLYLAVLILSVLLSLVLGISSILVGQIKVMQRMGDSVGAFYAANTGVERTLYEISKGADIGDPPFIETLESGASYIAEILGPVGTCPGPTYCIRSVGEFNGTKRAIRLIR